MRLAITGATGFVGGHLLDAARTAGHQVAALTRRPQAARDGVKWVEGALDDRASLDRLVAGADAVIHVAGVVNAPDEAGFEAGNVVGTGAVLAAAERACTARFVHVSSLAAREPRPTKDVALVRVEDLYPFPEAEVRAQAAKILGDSRDRARTAGDRAACPAGSKGPSGRRLWL